MYFLCVLVGYTNDTQVATLHAVGNPVRNRSERDPWALCMQFLCHHTRWKAAKQAMDGRRLHTCAQCCEDSLRPPFPPTLSALNNASRGQIQSQSIEALMMTAVASI
jgi:hypothetical protein